MKKGTVLITGGAGFIGSHLADELLAKGYAVRVLDALVEQVHGPKVHRPSFLDPRVQLVIGDVRNPRVVRRAVEGVCAVFHFAAAVGVGQSMYRIVDYMSVNDVGTAVLLEAMIEERTPRLVVASSMSVYGEGRYRSSLGGTHDHVDRSIEQLKRGEWEPSENGIALEPVPTPEEKAPCLSSVYALSKYDQERLCLLAGRAYGIDTIALRFFNVYGPRQALSNPYTGVLAIFAARLLNGRPPLLFEDGNQQRDFVSVYDVARACRLALEADRASGSVLNIGSGEPITIAELAVRTARLLGRSHIRPEVTGRYRVGDIRHCFADISLARDVLGYEPQVTLAEGLMQLSSWLGEQRPDDHAEQARRELEARGLAV